MHKIYKFLSWSPRDLRMMIKTYFTLICINLLLQVIPFNYMRKFIASQSKNNKRTINDSMVVHKIVETIEIASRYTPRKSTCLVKALTGYYLLTKHKIPVEMCIGVKLGLPGQLDAHAWIVYQGEVILGYLDNLPAYTKLTSPSMKAI